MITAHFKPYFPNWLAGFDDLVSLPRPRRAVLVYLLSSLIVTFATIAVTFFSFGLVEGFLPILAKVFRFEANGILAEFNFWGLIASAFAGCIWYQAMYVVRKFAGWVGGETKELAE